MITSVQTNGTLSLWGGGFHPLHRPHCPQDVSPELWHIRCAVPCCCTWGRIHSSKSDYYSPQSQRGLTWVPFFENFFFKLLSPACVSACMLITGFLSRHRIIDLTSVPAVLSQLSLPALQNGTSARLCFCPATAAHCPLWGHWTLWSLTHKHLIFTIRFTSIWLSFNFSWTPWTQVSARVHSCSSSLAFLFSLFLQYM